MRNFFRRRLDRWRGHTAMLDAEGGRKGAYTVEIPEIGAGHYVFDPSDSCGIHSRRLEAWCDIEDPAIARDELHWHCMMLSQLGIGEEPIRRMADQLIENRGKKLAADREFALERELAAVAGTVNSAPDRVDGEREERAQAEAREGELKDRARRKGEMIEKIRERFESLPRRERVPIGRTLVYSVSVSFTIFDVGVLGNAFELLAGEWYWKVVLTAGVALAPLSTAIGLAQWMSAAELPVREGVKATRLAILAGSLCIIGIGLIVLFRAAASGEPPLPWSAYLFLAFIQSALAIAETMIYVVYFDSRVGAALLKRIQAGEEELAQIDRQSQAAHQRGVSAQERIGAIELEAKEAESRLLRREPQQQNIQDSFEGDAGILKGIVDAAILEGVVAAQRAEERKRREEQERKKAPDSAPERWLVGLMGVVILFFVANSAGVL
jgi:hypothetical protein